MQRGKIERIARKKVNTVIEFGGRRSGRTTRLIKWLIEGQKNGERRVVMVHSKAEADRIRRHIDEYEDWDTDPVEIWQITTYDRTSDLVGKKVSEVAIDNLEMMLPRVGAPITLITATLAEEYSTHHQHGFEPKFPIQFRHRLA